MTTKYVCPLDSEIVQEVADLLAEHYQVKLGSGECACGHVVGLGSSFPKHQAAIVVHRTISRIYEAKRDRERATLLADLRDEHVCDTSCARCGCCDHSTHDCMGCISFNCACPSVPVRAEDHGEKKK